MAAGVAIRTRGPTLAVSACQLRDKGDLRGLGGPVGPEELLAPARVVEEQRRAVPRTKKRLDQRDQPGGRADVAGGGFVEILRVDMSGRGQWGGVDRGVDPEVDPAPALACGLCQMRHRASIGDVERGQRRRPACGGDAVIQLLQPACGARDGQHVPAFRTQRRRDARSPARAMRR